jgi:hypothetical protein
MNGSFYLSKSGSIYLSAIAQAIYLPQIRTAIIIPTMGTGLPGNKPRPGETWCQVIYFPRTINKKIIEKAFKLYTQLLREAPDCLKVFKDVMEEWCQVIYFLFHYPAIPLFLAGTCRMVRWGFPIINNL